MATASCARLPEAFSADKECATEWRMWKEEFNIFLTASDKAEKSDEIKVALLLNCMGSRWIKVFLNLPFEDAEKRKDYKEVIKQLDTYFEPKKMKKTSITKFQARKQKEGEEVNTFITELKDLAEQCEFGDLSDEMIGIQISNGVRNEKLREKLWDDDLTLTQIIQRCNMFEAKEKNAEMFNVNYAHQGQGRGSRGRGFRGRSTRGNRGGSSRGYGGPRSENVDEQFNRKCGKCGVSHAPRQCKAYNQTCHKCGKKNHFARFCKTKKVMQAELQEAESVHEDMSSMSLGVYAVDVVQRQKSRSQDQWSVAVCVKDTRDILNFKIDTGAECSLISNKTYSNLNVKPRMIKNEVIVKGVTGICKQTMGLIHLPVKYKSQNYVIKCHVIDSAIPNILSEQDSCKMKLIQRVNQVNKIGYNVSNAEKLLKNYQDVFEGIGNIPGQYALKCNPNAKPVAQPARPIPAPLREPTRNKLIQLQNLGIIEKVPVGEPTPWCAALHVVKKKTVDPKKPTDVRVTIDPQDLNRALLREYHPITTIEDVTTRTENAKLFTVLDAKMGYFQMSLTHESQQLTAFNTPFGRYKYLRLPMGISVAPELYQRAMTELMAGLDGVEVIMDDILIHAPTIEIHNQRLEKVLKRCRENNLKLNPEKTKLCRNEVEYIGHRLTSDGVKIGEDKVKAVVQMKEPESIEKVQQLLGMVTYTCKFMPKLSEVTQPLRDLIKESHESDFVFHFEEIHRETVTNLKKMMTSAPVLRFYSQTEPITISCDASQKGLGAVLMQADKPVVYASKALTKTEEAYAQIEKELLAIVFAMKKFHTYIYGRSDITVETDHLPLVRINEKPLHLTPLRLQKMKMALQHYSFKLVGKSGKDIPVADALSRSFIPETYEDLLQDVRHFKVYAEEVRGANAFSEEKWKQLIEISKEDEEMKELKKIIKIGWPENKKKINPILIPYYDARDELAVLDDVVFRAERVVIPQAMRRRLLEIIHSGHQGMVRSKQLARDVVYWPAMNKDIEEKVSQCRECQELRNYQQKENLKPSQVPARPWEVVASDLLYCEGRYYLVTVDYYSEYIDCEEMNNGTQSQKVIEILSKLFAVHGIPDKLLTDNGPQFSSYLFKQFAKDWTFNHVTTSPHHHEANGMVERANQTVKKIILKTKGDRVKLQAGLLCLRNTPKAESGSAVQRLMNRRTRTKIPTSDDRLKAAVIQPDLVKKTLKENRRKAERYYNRNAKPLNHLAPGSNIRVRADGKWRPAKLIGETDHPRSYNIIAPTGNTWRRNRRDILKTKETEMKMENDEDEDEVTMEDHNPMPLCPSSPFPPNPIPPMVQSPIPQNPPTHTYPTSRYGRQIKRPRKYNDYSC